MNIEEAQTKLKEGIVLANEEKYDDAIKVFQEILDSTEGLSAESASQIYVQKGRCHWEMRRWAESAVDFEKAHELTPDNPDCRWTLCLVYLQMNMFDKAWEYVETRWQSKKFDSPRLKSPKPQWTRDSDYKHVFVWSEQGIGDQILYLSMLHNIQEQCEKVTVMADARLFPVLTRSFPKVEFVPQNARIKGIDAHIPLGSIGAQFIHNLDDIENYAAKRYLRPDCDKVSKIREIAKKPGQRLIGLSWHSGAPRIGNHKSVPLPELLPLFKLPNTRFVSLQYGDCYEDIYELEKQHGIRIGIIPSIDNKDDMDGLAALICACDSVVTVSNATAHLAGALGAPTYVLNSNKLWYWSNVRGNRSVWYPSVKLYARDNVIAPWDRQILDLVEELK